MSEPMAMVIWTRDLGHGPESEWVPELLTLTEAKARVDWLKTKPETVHAFYRPERDVPASVLEPARRRLEEHRARQLDMFVPPPGSSER
jgi:hypothetical protein